MYISGQAHGTEIKLHVIKFGMLSIIYCTGLRWQKNELFVPVQIALSVLPRYHGYLVKQ